MKKQKIFYRIIRRTSQYNKYIKWYVETYKDKKGKNLVSSSGYRTQKKAKERIPNKEETFMAGSKHERKVKYIEI